MEGLMHFRKASVGWNLKPWSEIPREEGKHREGGRDKVKPGMVSVVEAYYEADLKKQKQNQNPRYKMCIHIKRKQFKYSKRKSP